MSMTMSMSTSMSTSMSMSMSMNDDSHVWWMNYESRRAMTLPVFSLGHFNKIIDITRQSQDDWHCRYFWLRTRGCTAANGSREYNHAPIGVSLMSVAPVRGLKDQGQCGKSIELGGCLKIYLFKVSSQQMLCRTSGFPCCHKGWHHLIICEDFLQIGICSSRWQDLCGYAAIWVFPKIGVPQIGWFIIENPIKTDGLGVPLFSETSIKFQ